MVYRQPTQQEIEQNWQDLAALIQAAGIDMEKASASNNNAELNNLQAVMRRFFIDLERDQPGKKPNPVIYGGNESHVLDFTRGLRLRGTFYPDKASFLKSQSQNSEWAEDVILFSGLSKLGINTVYDVRSQYAVASGRYQPYSVSNAKATFTLVNYFNGHWEMSGRSNAGRGNCGFYAVSQMVTQLWTTLQKQFKPLAAPTPPVAVPQKHFEQIPQQAKAALTRPATVEQKVVPTTEPKAVVETKKATTGTLYYTKANENHFVQTDKLDQTRFSNAKSVLASYDLATLVNMYHYACKNLAQGDTYLSRRPHHVKQEYGQDILGGVLKTGKAQDSTIALLAHEELVHMLATECKRNPMALEVLSQFAQPKACSNEVPRMAPPPTSQLNFAY